MNEHSWGIKYKALLVSLCCDMPLASCAAVRVVPQLPVPPPVLVATVKPHGPVSCAPCSYEFFPFFFSAGAEQSTRSALPIPAKGRAVSDDVVALEPAWARAHPCHASARAEVAPVRFGGGINW